VVLWPRARDEAWVMSRAGSGDGDVIKFGFSCIKAMMEVCYFILSWVEY
jgi:hypothetical protein